MNLYDPEIEEIILNALGHEIRRTILKIINTAENGASYTEIMTELGLPTGKLNYHLNQLEGLIERNQERRYVLTPVGEKAISILTAITQDVSPDLEKYLKSAQLAQRRTLHPIIKSFLLLSIVTTALGIAVLSYLFYLVLSEGAPLPVILVLSAILLIACALEGWLIYVLKRTPEFISRFERRLFGTV